MKEFYKKVAMIQSKLKAPKSQFNSFGKYSYRNQEDILEALKPLLKEEGLVLTVNDEVVEFSASNKIYIKSTATISDGENKLSNSAFARESDELKGMSTSQASGSCSSYARKYALNGLFLIDDTRDADATNTHGKTEVAETKVSQAVAPEVTASKPAPSFRRPAKTVTVSSGDDL